VVSHAEQRKLVDNPLGADAFGAQRTIRNPLMNA
jgi:hypothetical protein